MLASVQVRIGGGRRGAGRRRGWGGLTSCGSLHGPRKSQLACRIPGQPGGNCRNVIGPPLVAAPGQAVGLHQDTKSGVRQRLQVGRGWAHWEPPHKLALAGSKPRLGGGWRLLGGGLHRGCLCRSAGRWVWALIRELGHKVGWIGRIKRRGLGVEGLHLGMGLQGVHGRHGRRGGRHGGGLALHNRRC